MSDKGNSQANTERQFSIQRIYVKDISYETPNSPGIFRGEWNPDTQLNINTAIKTLEQNVYEVTLTLTLTAKSEDKTAYLVEVQQAGIFGVRGFSDHDKGPMLGSYIPNLLFPYAREVISDLVSKGSFPQMVLQPVNFDALYMQHQQELAKRAKGHAGQA